MSAAIDLAVVGAGPAGLAAATTAAGLGMKAIVLDEQPAPGGQIYRGVEDVATRRPGRLAIFGEDYADGLALVRRFRASGAEHVASAAVWQVDRDLTVHYRACGTARSLRARQVLLATGAMERPVPLRGWTLPGVMTCGAAQVLLKTAGVVPEGRVVLAGSGPLLLLLASQLLRAGARPAAILETPLNYRRALRHLPRFLLAPGYAARGLGMLGALRSAGVPYRRGVRDIHVVGTGHAECIDYECDGTRFAEAADVVLLHQGVVPNANLAWSLRCEVKWDNRQRCFRPVLDAWGRSSVAGVWIAGDGGGIAGARAAELSGTIAAFGAAAEIGRISAEECAVRASATRAELARHIKARAFLDALYRPAQEAVAPRAGDVIVCRCEEVTAGEIRRIVLEQDCPGPNQMKAFTRCGMGPCQGRLCGLTVTELIAEYRGISARDVGYYRIRPPVQPVTLGEIAGMEK